MTAKITNSGKAKLKRFESLPQMGENIVFGAVKKEIDNLIKTYQDGLANDDFGLIPLKPNTVKQKEKQGLSQPSTPLYGAGKDRKNTLYNVLRVRKIKNGYKIYMRDAKHWNSNLSLKQLFLIHNFGAKIQVGDTIIQIPPRPIFLLAYERMMSKIRGDKRLGKNVKRAITEYVNNANYKYADEYTSRVSKGENEQ